MHNVISAETNFAKIALGCVKCERHSGKVYSRHVVETFYTITSYPIKRTNYKQFNKYEITFQAQYEEGNHPHYMLACH